MSSSSDPFREALQNARQALEQGDRRSARRWAEKAVALAPQREEGWTLLAAVASPKASLTYLQRALRINPRSASARQGLDWALQRLNRPGCQAQTALQGSRRPAPSELTRLHLQPRIAAGPIPVKELIRHRPALLPWFVLVLALACSLAAIAASPTLTVAFDSRPSGLSVAQVSVSKDTRTPTPTETLTATPTKTSTLTPTSTLPPTETPTATALPTATNTPVPTETLPPTLAPAPTQPPAQDQADPTSTPGPVAEHPKKRAAQATAAAQAQAQAPAAPAALPAGLETGERWVDVDLSQQRAYAYQGSQLVHSFVVSTGTWDHPTVTGQYRIYVKYRYADMYGPGYNLPNVPFVMYFYNGYGLHGAYWHNNFGVPTSHGCVNFKVPDAAWLYDFASVGTLVNVQP